MSFKTIVATENIRAEFTILRNQLKSSDKELMQAFWNIGVDRLEDVKAEVARLQESVQKEKLNEKELKAAARKAAKPQKAKKEPKVKKVKKEPKVRKLTKEQEHQILGGVETVIHSDDGEETLVVCGL
jgi:hypothetical protein